MQHRLNKQRHSQNGKALWQNELGGQSGVYLVCLGSAPSADAGFTLGFERH
jgi:hypothetical protein